MNAPSNADRDLDMDALHALAAALGIAPSYEDIWGGTHHAAPESVRAVIAAMGVDLSAGERAALDGLRKARGEALMPPVLVALQGATIRIPIGPQAREMGPLEWRLELEDGTLHDGPLTLDVAKTSGHFFDLPPSLPCGYHWLRIVANGKSVARMRLIVTPSTCYRPGVLEDGRVFGPAVQLYTVRSRRNWGIGDFTDLANLVDYSADVGAEVIGLNPLHALFPHNPDHISPYSPSSRMFMNVLYIDVEEAAMLTRANAVLDEVRSSSFQARLETLRNERRVDYASVSALKLPLLRKTFERLSADANSEAALAFQKFRKREGIALRRQALFEVIQEILHAEDSSVWGWPAWPAAYHDPDGPVVAEFERANQEAIAFYEYLQWLANIQLHQITKRAQTRGMGIGLYQDLAVGVDRAGAETWANRTLFALDASVGAPPDELNLRGQNWGLPPWIPYRLHETGYEPFIATLRANMRHAGALRIDHVMALMRLFWIPPGQSAAEGVYVSYPFDDLLSILALESQRNRCAVIGEDLGTVPDNVREKLTARGVLLYRLLFFEKNSDGDFRAPDLYISDAVVAVTTHDLPTLAGYWQGNDLVIRNELNLFPSEEIRQQQIIGRAQDRARLLIALEREQCLPAGMFADPATVPDMTAELARSIHGYLAKTPCRIMLVNLEDVFGQTDQVNLPGTTCEYPNWSRKLAVCLEDLRAEPRAHALFGLLRDLRGKAVSKGLPMASANGPAFVIPRATYRLQLNRHFTFQQATEIVPYLAKLGISHCYISPYLKARPGSMHGYDIVNHDMLNPEIGTEEDFEAFVARLRAHGMGQILDIVPNHMGVGGSDNAWWLDVLENGPASVYAHFFDIDWQPQKQELRGKILLPILEDYYGAVLESGKLKLVFDPDSGNLYVNYHQHRLPIDPHEYPRVLGFQLQRLEHILGADHPTLLEYQSLVSAFRHLPLRDQPRERRAERGRDKEVHKLHLSGLCRAHPELHDFIERNLDHFNGIPDEPSSFRALHALLEAQAYRLAYWRVAADEINYRRFFDINDLAGLRMEDPEVFEASHAKLLRYIAEGKIDGLRIDHPDGLNDPAKYYATLQSHAKPSRMTGPESGDEASESPGIYVVVEKILASYEALPSDWAVQGTSGYDFGHLVNGLFVDSEQSALLTRVYTTFIGQRQEFDDVLYASKKHIMRIALASELNVLANQLNRLSESSWYTRDYTVNRLREALMEVVACFPVYRTYVRRGHVSPEDRKYVDWAVAVAKKRSLSLDVSIFDFLRRVLLLELPPGADEGLLEHITRFTMKFQQFSSPVMAKGMEDTAFYRYFPLASLNEVGGDPRRFGLSVSAFHHANMQRVKSWPHALLGTSTHDSKRSEDVRARLNVISEMPEAWREHLNKWRHQNRRYKRKVEEGFAPSRNDEYLLYQTLLGTWPENGPDEEYRSRIKAYMQKAVREAKTYTSWTNPNEAYEQALDGFIDAILTPGAQNLFLADSQPLRERIAYFGRLNSLAQTAIKLTAPGVPDIYQGNELWAFDLVDPDNRRPVDYARRSTLLAAMDAGVDAGALLQEGGHAAAKLFVTHRLLQLRVQQESLFKDGDYAPITVTGGPCDHLVVFKRFHATSEVVVVVPRLMLRLLNGHMGLPVGDVWSGCVLETGSRRYTDCLTGSLVTSDDRGHIAVTSVLSRFPIAVLVAE